MKALTELAPEIDAGKTAFLIWDTFSTFLFRDQDHYMLVSPIGNWSTEPHESISDMLAQLVEWQPKAHNEDQARRNNKLRLFQHLIVLPLWVAVDMSMPGIEGVTLLDLRGDLERGDTAFCLVDDKEYPYRVEQAGTGISFIAPPPMNDILASGDIETYLRAHLPIWQKGTSPAYQAVEDAFNREQQDQARELEALEAMPVRTVEMSEREYRAYQGWKEGETRRVAALYAQEFDPFLDSSMVP